MDSVFDDLFKKNAELESAFKQGMASVQDLLTSNPSLAPTAITLAIEEGQLYDAEQIILSCPGSITESAAYAAVKAGSQGAVSLLLHHGWDVNAPCASGMPMLSFAISDMTMVTHLLDCGADPNATHLVDNTPLSAAVRAGNLSAVEAMLTRGGDPMRGELFQHAVDSTTSDLNILGLLRDRNAPLDKIEYEDHSASLQFFAEFPRGTPLHTASAKGNLDAVHFLVHNGADPKRLNNHGRSPSQMAHLRGHHTICIFLGEKCGNYWSHKL